MVYDISKPTAPKMPTLGKGTECIKILLSQVSKDMYEPIVPMLFPVLGAHVSGSEFQYPDLSWKELCGMIANLVADSGGNKGVIQPFSLFVFQPFSWQTSICQFVNLSICQKQECSDFSTVCTSSSFLRPSRAGARGRARV